MLIFRQIRHDLPEWEVKKAIFARKCHYLKATYEESSPMNWTDEQLDAALVAARIYDLEQMYPSDRSIRAMNRVYIEEVNAHVFQYYQEMVDYVARYRRTEDMRVAFRRAWRSRVSQVVGKVCDFLTKFWDMDKMRAPQTWERFEREVLRKCMDFPQIKQVLRWKADFPKNWRVHLNEWWSPHFLCNKIILPEQVANLYMYDLFIINSIGGGAAEPDASTVGRKNEVASIVLPSHF